MGRSSPCPLPGFELAPLDEKVIAEARHYGFNRDVFDVTIIATAKLKDVLLITRDEAITNAKIVDICW
jgi:PIN domain nuclease of toxin-antitoxin system